MSCSITRRAIERGKKSSTLSVFYARFLPQRIPDFRANWYSPNWYRANNFSDSEKERCSMRSIFNTQSRPSRRLQIFYAPSHDIKKNTKLPSSGVLKKLRGNLKGIISRITLDQGKKAGNRFGVRLKAIRRAFSLRYPPSPRTCPGRSVSFRLPPSAAPAAPLAEALFPSRSRPLRASHAAHQSRPERRRQ
ncbi:hypothetical protein EVAR_26768_1 [Eumeta japonica]|uniref:Uncharacterized protein n=1 Tax=Eumeta variegata TaxID=151549 RepID=A0A4C1XCQ4_EUMVA|nr:hypothetical protein EVAR_26768_1 [Eumeta japonica]